MRRRLRIPPLMLSILGQAQLIEQATSWSSV